MDNAEDKKLKSKNKRLHAFVLRDRYGWSIEKIQKEVEAASVRHAEMLGWTNYKIEITPSKITVEDEPIEYLVKLWNKDIQPKRYLLEWRETVTNNCSVYIEAESEAEALEKWESGEYEDYETSELSNSFDDPEIMGVEENE